MLELKHLNQVFQYSGKMINIKISIFFAKIINKLETCLLM